jgi:hypothetical protein
MPTEELPLLSTFSALLPGPPAPVPPVCPPAAATAKTYHARFGNNNFVVHSHLTSVAHGVFPLASIWRVPSCRYT